MSSVRLSEATGISPDTRPHRKSNDFILPEQYVGVEIELEDMGNFPAKKMSADSPYWHVKPDGSLRNNPLEFVFKQPMCSGDVQDAFAEFNFYLDNFLKRKAGGKLEMSDRCSVHVHLDVRDLTSEELFKILIVYTIYEKVLFHYIGQEREYNNYCVPYYMSANATHWVAELLTSSASNVAHALSSCPKYAALNIQAARQFGSIEFRHLYGTYDTGVVTEWINIIMCLKKAALETKVHMDDLPGYISSSGTLAHLNDTFEGYAKRLRYNGISNDIMTGMRVAQDMIYHLRMAKEESNFLCSDKLYCKDNPAVLKYFADKGMKPRKTLDERLTKKVKLPSGGTINVTSDSAPPSFEDLDI